MERRIPNETRDDDVSRPRTRGWLRARDTACDATRRVARDEQDGDVRKRGAVSEQQRKGKK